jgi:hypothetical protein
MRRLLPVRDAAHGVALVLAAGMWVALAACSDAPAPFHKVDGAWHYRDARIDGVDGRTFAPLDDHYAKDRARVYYGASRRDGQEYFSIRHDGVRVIDGADAATLRVLRLGYAKDAQAVYHDGVRFAVRDPATFELLEYGFAKDRVSGYWHQAEIAGSDGPSFTHVDGHYAKDRAHAWHVDFVLDGGAHPPVAQAVTLAGADLGTFVALEAGYAKDARQVWHRGRVVSHAPATLAVLPYDYARTATEVFHRGTRMADADAASFAVLDAPTDDADARDTRGAFRAGRRVGR